MKLQIMFCFVAIVGLSSSYYIEKNSSPVCSSEVPEEYKTEYSKFANSVSTIFESFKSLTNSSRTVSCQFGIKSIVTNFSKVIDESLKSIETEMQSTLIEIRKLVSNEVNIVTVIREGDFCVARNLIMQQNDIPLQQLVPAVYEGNLEYGEKLLGFLDSLSGIEKAILGYRILFDEMIKKGQLYTTLTTRIAYQVMNIFHLKHAQNQNYIYLRNNLPKSFKNFPWTEQVLIKNSIDNEQLFVGYAVNSILQFDSFRFKLYTYLGADHTSAHLKWTFSTVSNGSYFIIRDLKYNNFVYADTDKYALSNQRRRVFSWIPQGDPSETARWQFEPVEGTDFFKIKNIYWNEYLFINDEFLQPDALSYRNLFTWRPGGCEQEGCKWKFIRV